MSPLEIYTHRMDALAHLTALRTAWDTRAQFIVMAREQRKQWDEIAEAAGLSRATVINLYNAHVSGDTTASVAND